MAIYDKIKNIIATDDGLSSPPGEKKSNIGYTCNFIPPEIIYAAGMIPVKIFHNADISDVSIGDTYMQRNACPFVRGCIGNFINGGYDDLNGIIGAHTCDNMRGMCENLDFFEIPPQLIYQLDIPRNPSRENNVNYYASQLKEMASILEKISDNKITPTCLVQAIELYAQLRKSLRNIYTCVQTKQTGVESRLLFQLIHKMMTVDPAPYIPVLSEIENACLRADKMPRNGKPRIALMGSLLLKDNYQIIEAVESKNARIVDDFICSGSRYLHQKIELSLQEDPFFSVAAAYLQSTACPRMYDDQFKKERLLQLLDPNNIDGVIFYVLKFCDSALYESVYVKNLCKEADIACLIIESELAGRDQGQINTRVEAFLENIHHF